MNIVLYVLLLYIGLGFQVGGVYVFMIDIPKILNNELKIESISDMIKYLGNGIIRITIAALIWPKTVVCIVKWFKNIIKHI